MSFISTRDITAWSWQHASLHDARSRRHNQPCNVLVPTRPASAGARRCRASRQRARCQASSAASTRTRRAPARESAASSAISLAANTATSAKVEA